MSWPQSQEYNEAIQSPATSFADAELRTGEAVTNDLGLPMPRSGNFADVYEVRCPNGSRWAVKCFTREVPGLRERYQEISRHLQQAKLPFTVEFTYLDKGIRIHGNWYPLLKMQWVEGFTLNDFVRQQLDKPAMLGALLQIWGRMATRLREAGIAHADLQHGNVLLVPGANANSLALKLIDYDGMFVPALAGTKSGEVGHPSYQHPQRLREGTYTAEVDRFPLLLIAASLQCLQTGGRALWEKYDNGDNLLFKEADLRNPDSSALFAELQTLGEPTVAAVRKALACTLEKAPLLEEFMPEPRPAAAAVPAAKPTATPVAPVVTKASPAVQTTTAPTANPWAFEKSASAGTKTKRPQPKSTKRSGLLLAVLAGGVAALLLLAGTVAVGAIFFLKGRGSDKVATTDSAPWKGLAATDKRPDKPGGDGGTKQDKAQPGIPVVAPVDKGPAVAPVDKGPAVAPPDTGPTIAPPDTGPIVGPPDKGPIVGPPDKGPTGKPLLPIDPEPRLPVPDEAAQAAAEKAIKEEHKDDYAKKKPAEIQALAALLRRKGKDSQRKPETRFVLFREARDLAARAGDLPLALQVANEMAVHFDVNAFEMKAAALQAAVPTAMPTIRPNFAALALSIADDAAEVDDYSAAEHLVQVAQKYTKELPNSPANIAALARQKELADLRKAYEPLQDEVRTLAKTPADPQANLALGKFYALSKGDWDRGLTLLARSNDAKLKALAESDLASPVDAAAKTALGDRYVAQATPETGLAKSNLLCRASYWYRLAESQLSEQERMRMTRLLAEIDRSLLPHRPVVLHAQYGAFDGWADVTPRIRCLSVLDKTKMFALNVITPELEVDPAPFQHKSLVVVYRYRGGVHLSITGEGATANQLTVTGSMDTDAGRPAPGQELVILNARYGNEDRYGDATAKVQAAVNGATLSAHPDKLGLADSYPGRHKALIIVYRDDGRVYLSVTPQNATAMLKAGAAKP